MLDQSLVHNQSPRSSLNTRFFPSIYVFPCYWESNPYQWSMLTGDKGGWANILDMKSKEVLTLFYDDNEKQEIFGSIGYRMNRIDDQDALRFETYIFLLPPNAGPEQMEQQREKKNQPPRLAGRDGQAAQGLPIKPDKVHADQQ